MNYEPSLDLVCMMKYLEESRVSLISCFGELEEFIHQLFTRIK